jgi:hypothetical protein
LPEVIVVMRLLLVLALTIGLSVVAVRAQTSSDLGYPTVAAALEALQKRADVRISRQGGWTIVDDRGSLTLWSFAPDGHPAHPAVVRRKIVEEQGQIFVRMNVLCEASKAACDALVADFNKLNQQMADDLNRRKQPN